MPDEAIVRYRGPAAFAGMLASELRVAGYEVEYEAPIEQRGAGADFADVVYKVTSHPLVVAGVIAVVHGFLKRRKDAKVEVDGDEVEPSAE
jgi:hypothetical protein